MSPEFIVIRHELASAAIASINSIYAVKLSSIQAVKNGDGAILKQINWGAFTPLFKPKTFGYLPQWTSQQIALELRASVDYSDRSLDSRYLSLLQVFEDFCARPDLAALLSNENIIVESPPTFEEGAETIDNGRFITTYPLLVSARGRMEGE